MVMGRKPVEIIAGCELPAFPTAADITHVQNRIEAARRSRSDVVSATVVPPAIYRDKRYVLETKLVVWAGNASRAVEMAKELLAHAGLSCRTVLPSGRALIAAEVPPPSEPEVSGPRAAGGHGQRTGRGTPRSRAAKGAARRKTRPR